MKRILAAAAVLVGVGIFLILNTGAVNKAVIGKNCLVGAGALITEGKEFPDSSLIVGAPARATRLVDEPTIKMIAAGADIYVRRWQDYAKGLKRIR